MNINEVEETLEQMRKLQGEIKAAEVKRDESIAFHQNKIEVAKRICDVDTRESREEFARLSYSLEVYYKENPPKKGKSHKFSGGTFGYHKQSPKYFFNGVEISSESPDLVAYIKKFYDSFVKKKEYVDWASFKNAVIADDSGVYFAETGEILDGFSARMRPDSFKVVINE